MVFKVLSWKSCRIFFVDDLLVTIHSSFNRSRAILLFTKKLIIINYLVVRHLSVAIHQNQAEGRCLKPTTRGSFRVSWLQLPLSGHLWTVWKIFDLQHCIGHIECPKTVFIYKLGNYRKLYLRSSSTDSFHFFCNKLQITPILVDF